MADKETDEKIDLLQKQIDDIVAENSYDNESLRLLSDGCKMLEDRLELMKERLNLVSARLDTINEKLDVFIETSKKAKT